MVHQHYRSAVAALQAAQISEQRGDLGSAVLINARNMSCLLPESLVP
jgi:hypothetical protein